MSWILISLYLRGEPSSGIGPFTQRLTPLTRKKADTLLLQQKDLMSLLDDKSSRIFEALLETRTMVKENLLSSRNATHQTLQDNTSNLQSSTVLALWDAQTVEVEIVESLHFPLIDDLI